MNEVLHQLIDIGVRVYADIFRESEIVGEQGISTVYTIAQVTDLDIMGNINQQAGNGFTLIANVFNQHALHFLF